jgi:drug/metabolite transporter (DMT)-like permease
MDNIMPKPILADAIGPIVLLIFLAPIILAIAARIAMIALKSRRGQRPWWGLAIGLASIIAGAGLILMLATTRGGVPIFFYLAAALPIVAGLGCLIVWNKKPKQDKP